MQYCTQTFDGDATDWADGHLKRFVAVFVGFFSWQFFHGVRSSFEFGERIARATGATTERWRFWFLLLFRFRFFRYFRFLLLLWFWYFRSFWRFRQSSTFTLDAERVQRFVSERGKETTDAVGEVTTVDPLFFCLFISLLRVFWRRNSTFTALFFLFHHAHARHEVVVGSFIEIHRLNTSTLWRVDDGTNVAGHRHNRRFRDVCFFLLLFFRCGFTFEIPREG